jgi:hypothetical protein
LIIGKSCNQSAINRHSRFIYTIPFVAMEGLRARATCRDRFNSLRTDGDFCHQGWDTEIAHYKDLRLSKPTDMTIHYIGKLLAALSAMVPLVFRFIHCRRKLHFLNFSQKSPVLQMLCFHFHDPEKNRKCNSSTNTIFRNVGQALTAIHFLRK